MNAPCKKLIIFILFKLASLSLLADPIGVIKEQEAVNWEIIKKAYEEYVDYPSTENANKLCDTLPKEDIGNRRGEDNGVIAFIFKYNNYRVLEYQILAGDRNALKVAFRLFNISDASSTESIQLSLSNVVRIFPRYFLQELEAHKGIRYIREMGYPTYYLDPVFWDREKAEIYELEMRIKALGHVDDKKLRAIRDECINQLKEYIKKYQKILWSFSRLTVGTL